MIRHLHPLKKWRYVKMQTNYEFFKKEFQFQGKHARMAGELWVQNDYTQTYFKRLIDLYMIAPVIGFRMGRKSAVDTSTPDVKSVFAEQIIKERENLEFILQMIIMLEVAETETEEIALKKAFRGAETLESFNACNKLFNDYARGGVEELYERLVIKRSEINHEFYEEKTANIMDLIQRFTEN